MSSDNELSFDYPPPATFDAEACAHAKPVEPIKNRQHASWPGLIRAGSKRFSKNARLLVVVVIGGFAIGAMGSTAFLHKPRASSAIASFNDASIGVAAMTVTKRVANFDEAEASKNAAAVSVDQIIAVHPRHRRLRLIPNGPPRAYRVATIH